MLRVGISDKRRYIRVVFASEHVVWYLYMERCINKILVLTILSKKGICKNCGDPIEDENNSNEFCSSQCKIEYQLEHNRK